MEDNLARNTKRMSFQEFWESLNVKDYGVYRIYDARNELLYVGITRVFRSRMEQHYSMTAWMQHARRIEFEHGFSEEEARIREGEYIRGLKPIHNRVVPLGPAASKPQGPPRRKGRLSPAERRTLTLRALRGENRRRLSGEYGVGESYIYKLLDLATADPDAALAEAEAELAFRREVREITGNRS